jgi:pyruvate dehydrogenase (quinone)
MSMNVSDFVWHRLQEWGLRRVYGYPGDGVGGLDVALEKVKDTLQYVQVRHEEMAAFMASGHAKFTGGVGLCYATSGPGAIHLLTGLYDAKMDRTINRRWIFNRCSKMSRESLSRSPASRARCDI